MAEEMELRPCGALLAIWLVSAVVGALIPGGIAASICASERGDPLVGFGVGWLIPLALAASYLVLYFYSIRYEVDDRYVAKSHGVLWKARRSIPVEKITNIDVRQGPVERLLGFGQVWIFTPSTGAATPEEKLVGVLDPHRIKQAIIERGEAAKAAPAAAGTGPAGDAAVAAEGEVVALLREMLQTLQRIEGKLGGE